MEATKTKPELRGATRSGDAKAFLWHAILAVPASVTWLINAAFYALLVGRFTRKFLCRDPDARAFREQFGNWPKYAEGFTHLGTHDNDASWSAEVVLGDTAAFRVSLSIPVETKVFPLAVARRGEPRYCVVQGSVSRDQFRPNPDGLQECCNDLAAVNNLLGTPAQAGISSQNLH